MSTIGIFATGYDRNGRMYESTQLTVDFVEKICPSSKDGRQGHSRYEIDTSKQRHTVTARPTIKIGAEQREFSFWIYQEKAGSGPILRFTDRTFPISLGESGWVGLIYGAMDQLQLGEFIDKMKNIPQLIGR